MMSLYSKKFFVGQVTAVLLALVVFVNAPGVLAAGKAPLRVGDSPPKIALVNLNGSTVRIPDDFRGKVLILHFWTGGCSSCREEMPAMEKLYGKYGRKGLVILAVNVGQNKETVRRLAKDLGVSYPVLLDQDRKMAGSYDVIGVPRTYMIDRKGVIRYKILGSASDEMLKKQILSLL
ncbi:MAG: TlpA family protein disulfide reductase [Deltaproteobacteria bacterium]|nr:TlpA family protein disulfide reductase [Deltaproteobacteria bacterium]